MSARPERGDVVISTKFFTHSGLKQCGSSRFALAASWHRHKNGSARSRSSPLRSTRKNSCSSPILRTGRSPGRDRLPLVGASTSGASASISNMFPFLTVDQTHRLGDSVCTPGEANGYSVHVRGHASACRSSVGEARVGFVVRRGHLLLEALQQPLQIVQEYVGGVPAVTVPDYHPERYEVFPVFGERVRRHLPAALAHPARDVEGRIPVHFIPKLESKDGKLATVGYELEGTELRDSAGDVGRHVPALLLDAPVALETEPEEVVVLCNDLRARAREVQGERGHVSPEVVHPEDEILGQGLGIAPQGPAHPWVHPAVLVARGVYRRHARQAKIPHQVRVYYKGCDHSPRSPV